MSSSPSPESAASNSPSEPISTGNSVVSTSPGRCNHGTVWTLMSHAFSLLDLWFCPTDGPRACLVYQRIIFTRAYIGVYWGFSGLDWNQQYRMVDHTALFSFDLNQVSGAPEYMVGWFTKCRIEWRWFLGVRYILREMTMLARPGF